MLTVILCIIAADFLTGLGHWIEDTYGVPTWPLLGKQVIEPNIMHHEHPTWIGSMSTLISRNYQTCVPAFAVSVALLWWFGWTCWPAVLIVSLTAMGNEVHTWCHRGNNNGLIRFLQDSGLAQSPRQHAKHHKPPYDRYFCTLTNFTNEVLEAVRFWPALEWTLACIGIVPKRMSEQRRGV